MKPPFLLLAQAHHPGADLHIIHEPVFGSDVFLWRTTDYATFANAIKRCRELFQEEGLDHLFDTPAAGTCQQLVHKGGTRSSYHIHVTQDPSLPPNLTDSTFMVHEVTHLADFIMEDVGVAPTEMETRAYLVTFFAGTLFRLWWGPNHDYKVNATGPNESKAVVAEVLKALAKEVRK